MHDSIVSLAFMMLFLRSDQSERVDLSPVRGIAILESLTPADEWSYQVSF